MNQSLTRRDMLRGTVAFATLAFAKHPLSVFGFEEAGADQTVVPFLDARGKPTQYLAKKLWEFYAFPNPSAEEIAPVAQALSDSNYELKPALRALFTSPAFYDGKAKFALIQSPSELSVSTARLLEQNLREEESMRDWLNTNGPDILAETQGEFARARPTTVVGAR